MTLRLTVQRQAWLDHVHSTADAAGQMVPVVKGNGYGFGRPILIEQAVGLGHEIAVGTAYEARDVPTTHTPIVLTPLGTDVPSTLPSNSTSNRISGVMLTDFEPIEKSSPSTS